VLEFPEVEDRLTLVHHVLGTDFAPDDLSGTWTLIEEKSALPPDDGRDLLGRLLDRT
jgi:hypothetical protein